MHLVVSFNVKKMVRVIVDVLLLLIGVIFFLPVIFYLTKYTNRRGRTKCRRLS